MRAGRDPGKNFLYNLSLDCISSLLMRNYILVHVIIKKEEINQAICVLQREADTIL